MAVRSKKSPHALEQYRPDILKRRRARFDGQLDLDPAKLVFIDATGLSTQMARLRGRAPRGERCRAGVPHGHWKTISFAGTLRLTGTTTPFVYDGAMNGSVFLAYVAQVLVPTLARGRRHHGQLAGAQDRRRSRGDRDRRRKPALPSALRCINPYLDTAVRGRQHGPASTAFEKAAPLRDSFLRRE